MEKYFVGFFIGLALMWVYQEAVIKKVIAYYEEKLSKNTVEEALDKIKDAEK